LEQASGAAAAAPGNLTQTRVTEFAGNRKP